MLTLWGNPLMARLLTLGDLRNRFKGLFCFFDLFSDKYVKKLKFWPALLGHRS